MNVSSRHVCVCVCECVCEVQPANNKIKNKMERNAPVTIKYSHKINYIQRSTKSKLAHSPRNLLLCLWMIFSVLSLLWQLTKLKSVFIVYYMKNIKKNARQSLKCTSIWWKFSISQRTNIFCISFYSMVFRVIFFMHFPISCWLSVQILLWLLFLSLILQKRHRRRFSSIIFFHSSILLEL